MSVAWPLDEGSGAQPDHGQIRSAILGNVDAKAASPEGWGPGRLNAHARWRDCASCATDLWNAAGATQVNLPGPIIRRRDG